MISRANAEHYKWGENCDGWHLVRSPGMSIIHERMPAGTAEVKHYHRNARQFFFVLRGTATMIVSETTHTLRAHEGVEIAPGAPHQMRNESAEEIEFLVVSAPPAHGDRHER